MVTADDARQLRKQKGTVNHETYKMIYGRVQARISHAASKGRIETDFSIPSIIPGRPMFDVTHAVRYVRDKLRYNGFRVTELDVDVIRINWKPDKKARHPPPPPPPPPRKTVLPGKISPPSRDTVSPPQRDTIEIQLPEEKGKRGRKKSTSLSKSLQELKDKLAL